MKPDAKDGKGKRKNLSRKAECDQTKKRATNGEIHWCKIILFCFGNLVS